MSKGITKRNKERFKFIESQIGICEYRPEIIEKLASEFNISKDIAKQVLYRSPYLLDFKKGRAKFGYKVCERTQFVLDNKDKYTYRIDMSKALMEKFNINKPQIADSIIRRTGVRLLASKRGPKPTSKRRPRKKQEQEEVDENLTPETPKIFIDDSDYVKAAWEMK